MSAGAFKAGKYLDNAGNIWEVRIQPESEGLTLDSVANAEPSGTLTANLPKLPINVSSRRKFGIKMRSVTVELTANGAGATADYLGMGTRFTVPVFDPDNWDLYAKDDAGTYLGIACVFVRKSNEEVN